MKLQIRQEREEDQSYVFDVIQKAFEKEQISDHQEHYLVERLRKSNAFVPELSLVALVDSQIVGHILLTKIEIRNRDHTFPSLALAPVSVTPDFQGREIGSALIIHAHDVARSLGYGSVILLGHAEYYPRFGYRPAHQFNIRLPFDVPLENCMAIELFEGALQGIEGIVEYPPEFRL